MPMAEAAPMVLPHTHPAEPQVALLPPAAPQPAAPQPAAPEPAAPVVSAPLPAVSAQVPQPVPVPQPPVFATAAPIPHFAAKPAHHAAHHAAPPSQPWLAQAGGYQGTQRRHADHHAAPSAAPAPREFYAANVPPRDTAPAPRITPQAATVMYSPLSGSSLGMAASASLAPPRPLYPNSQ
jgi:flagellar biosynthesis protein FlhF